eukprot:9496730-Pyramimonas_sp.AAC.1
MSTDQFDAVAAVLSQGARDKLKHMRWRTANGLPGSVQLAQGAQQQVDKKADQLLRAEGALRKARGAA